MAKKRPAPSKLRRSRPGPEGTHQDWLARQKARLDKKREQLRVWISSEADQLKIFGTHNPREDADIAEETWEDEEVSRTVEVLQARFQQVEDALEHIQNGAYGRCLDCKKAIPHERLDAVPSAVRCVECQKRFEEKTAKPQQPR
jgi:RNA polymerase-binding transcription factor DksA